MGFSITSLGSSKVFKPSKNVKLSTDGHYSRVNPSGHNARKYWLIPPFEVAEIYDDEP